jgi:hypothetical protein
MVHVFGFSFSLRVLFGFPQIEAMCLELPVFAAGAATNRRFAVQEEYMFRAMVPTPAQLSCVPIMDGPNS